MSNVFPSECRECRCNDGKITCSKEKCGNPVPKGCYVKRGTRCVFQSPCPEDAVHDKAKFCLDNPGKRYCNHCFMCTCGKDSGTGGCGFAQAACLRVDESMGSYAPLNGVCVWQAPHP